MIREESGDAAGGGDEGKSESVPLKLVRPSPFTLMVMGAPETAVRSREAAFRVS